MLIATDPGQVGRTEIGFPRHEVVLCSTVISVTRNATNALRTGSRSSLAVVIWADNGSENFLCNLRDGPKQLASQAQGVHASLGRLAA